MLALTLRAVRDPGYNGRPARGLPSCPGRLRPQGIATGAPMTVTASTPMIGEKMSNQLNAYAVALAQYDKATGYLKELPAGILANLRMPKRELTVNFPVKMDAGGIQMYTGFRVHHNTVRGP